MQNVSTCDKMAAEMSLAHFVPLLQSHLPKQQSDEVGRSYLRMKNDEITRDHFKELVILLVGEDLVVKTVREIYLMQAQEKEEYRILYRSLACAPER